MEQRHLLVIQGTQDTVAHLDIRGTQDTQDTQDTLDTLENLVTLDIVVHLDTQG